MPNKALTIDVNSAAVPNGSLNRWTPLGNTGEFINNILTPQLSKETNVGQLVSGIPSAFARVDLFKKALDYVVSNTTAADDSGARNLLTYYRQLASEWRGLIACLALDYAHITVRTITLEYSDGLDIDATANVYEPKGAFGNMLMDRAALWTPQGLANNVKAHPVISVIKYDGKVVGATAPESLLFTSSGYSLTPSSQRPWVDIATGRFTDPLNSEMTPEQVATLHAYVEHLLFGIDRVAAYFPKELHPGYNSAVGELENWRDALAAHAATRRIDLTTGSVPPVSAPFAAPFNDLFCHSDILYGLEGIIDTAESKTPGAVEFDPGNLLLDETARIARLGITPGEDMRRFPILVLTATGVRDTETPYYFALPLSAQGLNVFGKNVAALVGMNDNASAITSSLTALFDEERQTLEVNLTIRTSTGAQRSFKKVYNTGEEIRNKDVLIWPNFISPRWDAYYMYSEMPHNGMTQGYRAFPFVGEMDGNYFRIMVDADGRPVLLSGDGRIVAPAERVKAELPVKSDDAVAGNPYQYEIYRSNRPYKGVRLLSPTGSEGGYLLINYSAAPDSGLPQDMMLTHPSLQEVRLGIDFGSTNTSIAYYGAKVNDFRFVTQRVSLMGYEMPGRPVTPRENIIFFFQGAGPEVRSNSVKSVLTLHDPRRMRPLKDSELPEMRAAQEVVGGFPCMAENLPFTNSTERTITLSFPNGVGNVTQIHNMKWEDSAEDKAHKSAFLRTLLLQVYARLFADGYVPTSLKWSYPSAMSGHLLLQYNEIWNMVGSVCPVLDVEGKRYKLDVSTYTDPGITFPDTPADAFGMQQADTFGGGFDSAFGSFSSDPFGASGGDLFGASGGDAFDTGFGTQPAAAAPAATPATPLMPDDPDRQVVYNPIPLTVNKDNKDNKGNKGNKDGNPSYSEAEAVACYVASKNSIAANVLDLCFDIGGSTTDISALFLLKGGVTMVKQNSIRFAAQLVSRAVSRFPAFKNVLLNVCERYGIRMLGLNMGPQSYNADTAPYFFDQIVNRLSDEQLPELYRLIATGCPQLMHVNLYVTGLLMFYAGEIANKLVDDLNHATVTEWTDKGNKRPEVRVTFAGKGSRLMQWFEAINPRGAEQYYGRMFILGYGQQALTQTLKKWQTIKLPEVNDTDIKYEVSKGLAKGDSKLRRPSDAVSNEIVGEAGYEVVGPDNKPRPVAFTNTMTPEMMRTIGIGFRQVNDSELPPKFTEFLGLYYQAARQFFGWNVTPDVLRRSCADLNVVGFAQNMEEFRSAQRAAQQDAQQPFDFVAPIIILEGMKFYDAHLLSLL